MTHCLPSSSSAWGSALAKRQIGFLTYDLQPFTEDCLFRISQSMEGVNVKAFPVFHHGSQINSRLPFRPSFLRKRFLGLDVPGSTPEGFASNVNLGCAWAVVKESTVVVLFGIQGSTAIFAAAFATLLRTPLVSVNQTLPMKFERNRRWWIRLLKGWVLRRCVCHVYQSPVTREVLRDVYHVDEAQLYYAPFEAGASLVQSVLRCVSHTKQEIRERYGIAVNEVVFLFVGTLNPFKGIPEIIRALAIPPRLEVRCVFAGPEEPQNKSGGTIGSYLRFAQEMGVGGQVLFVGHQTMRQLAELYVASDVVVLPTRKDPFPKVLVEGAMAGKPLITTWATGAVGAIVLDGVNGVVVNPGDVRGLRRAMERMLDPTARERMGARSRELAVGFCSPEQETKGFAAALTEVLALGRNRR